MQNHILPLTDNLKFLGVILTRANSFKLSWNEAKSKFFISANTIVGRLGASAPLNTLIKLVNTHGLQNLLYATASVSLGQSEINNLDFSYNSFFSKIFKTKSQQIITECFFFCGILPFYLQYDFQRYTFLKKIFLQGFLSVESAADASDLEDMTKIQSRYALSFSDSPRVLREKFWSWFTNKVAV